MFFVYLLKIGEFEKKTCWTPSLGRYIRNSRLKSYSSKVQVPFGVLIPVHISYKNSVLPTKYHNTPPEKKDI